MLGLLCDMASCMCGCGSALQGLRPGYLLLVSTDSITDIQIIEAVRAVSKEIRQCCDPCRCLLHLQSQTHCFCPDPSDSEQHEQRQ